MLDRIHHKKKPKPLRYTLYNHTDELPDVDWKMINTTSNVFFSLDYLKTLEKTLADAIDFRYILFYDDETPVGFAALQLIKFNSSQLKTQEFPCHISDAIKNKLFKNLDVGVLICGNIFSCGEHGFVYNKNLVDTKVAYDSLAIALLKIRKSENTNKPSFILLKEFWPNSLVQLATIKKHDFKEFTIDVNMVLEINSNWKNFADYLANMRTKFRTRTKKVFEKSKDIVTKEFNATSILDYGDEINKLYLSVIEKADFQIGKLNANTFSSIKESLQDKFIFNGYFLEDKLVGFATYFKTDDYIDANHIGIDYTFNKSHAIYQKMLYDYVDIAINQNTKELRLGRTAETIKSCVGAKPVEMKLYVRHGNAISNTLLKPLVELISTTDYEIRNPFKLKTN